MRLVLISVLFLAYIALIVYYFIEYDSSENRPVAERAVSDTAAAMHTADSLLALFYKAFENGDFDKAREIAGILNNEYPGSAHAARAAQLMETLDSKPKQNREYARRSQSQQPTRTPYSSLRGRTREADRTSSRRAPGSASQMEELNARLVENEQRLKAAMSRMRKVRDEQQGITWYYNKNVSHYVYKNSFEAYVGQADKGEVWLRLKIYYNGEKELNINTYEIYADDRVYTISTIYGDLKRGQGPGGAWEWYDMQVSAEEKKIIQAVMTADRAAIRYIGESGSWERAVTEGEKLRLADVMETYQALSIQKEILSLNSP